MWAHLPGTGYFCEKTHNGMNERSIRAIIGLMTLALLGIVLLQAYSIWQAVRLNEQKFNKNVLGALGRVAKRLEHEEVKAAAVHFDFGPVRHVFDSVTALAFTGNWPGPPDPECRTGLFSESGISSLQSSVEAWLAMQVALPVENRPSLRYLDRVLREELIESDVHLDYAYGIFSKLRNGFVLLREVSCQPDREQSGSHLPEIASPEARELLRSPYHIRLFPLTDMESGTLVLHFPHKRDFLFHSVWLHLFCTLAFVGIVLFCFAYTIRVIFRQKKLSEIKNDFINNMTHEFKTPIATISLAADALTAPSVVSDPARIGRFANIIRQENRRMNSQVEKVLQMALVDKKEFRLNLVPVDMNALVESAVDNISLQVEACNGKIFRELNAAHAVVKGDETHLTNIVHNLLDNANKYSPEKPAITVRTRDVSGGVQLDVEDRGIGIGAEALKSIFDPFYRIHTGNRHDVKGFGLGLSYVQAMVAAHGGHIEVHSEPGKGSRFSVFLPAQTEHS
jgi:two-component system phosphate regulon sensor histidine kinase PhoR